MPAGAVVGGRIVEPDGCHLRRVLLTRLGGLSSDGCFSFCIERL